MSDLVGKIKYSINLELWGAPNRKIATKFVKQVDQDHGGYVPTDEYNFDLEPPGAGDMIGPSPFGNAPGFGSQNEKDTIGSNPKPLIGYWAESYTRPDLPTSYNYNNITFLSYDEQGYLGKDNLRVALGKSWTEKLQTPESTHRILSHNDKPYDLFYGHPILLDHCGPENFGGLNPGFLPDEMDSPEGVPPYLKETVYIERLGLAVTGSLPYYTPEQRAQGEHEGKLPSFDEWAGFIKVGITEQNGKTYRPIVNKSGKAYHGVFQNEVFNDHVYSTVEPFTQKELLSKQPFGKAAQVTLSTYYNTGYDSTEWEKFISNLGTEQYFQGASPYKASGYDVGHMYYNNVMPTPYGLLRLMTNKFEVSSLYDEEKMLSNFWHASSFQIGNTNSQDRNAFVKYPYELSMTMNGLIPSGSISKLVNAKPKNQDVQDQFAEYLKFYMQEFSKEGSNNSMTQHRVAMELIDQVFDNVAISPSSLKSIDKIHQLKKYFPFYAEMGFSTSQNTQLGDIIKQILFGKYFVNKIAGYNTYSDPLQAFIEDSDVQQGQTPPLGNPKMLSFADYRQEKTYEDDGDAYEAPKLSLNAGSLSTINKKYYPIVEDLHEYIQNPDTFGIPTGIDKNDIQNHIAYLRDDVAEPIDVNEYNNIWKIVLGTVLKQKLIQTYKENHRTYQDLLAGKPAYHEDIAYKVEKWAKRPEDTDQYWTISQSIIIPNTSDINIFNYVDTQMKYGYDMMYMYRIYAIKVVFGCSYDYVWGDKPADSFSPWLPYLKTSEADGEYLSGEYHMEDDQEGGIKKFIAQVGVRIFPNIAMLEDLFYESPKVYISDHPPVPPDANIVPYRGKSDKILILLNGMVDTFRAEPIYMMDSDVPMFEFVKNAQLSVDGKITFSEDSPAKNSALKFQIFRTKTKPMSYTDFELYDTISETSLEDKVMANQKYWYTFRAIDMHGHISNPTAVYQVELVDDHGSVKPIIRTFNFEEPKYFEAIKECQKYLMIKPNLKQLYYNSEKDSIDHMFNDSDSSGVKRRFKVRITSKSTGKKIDLNLDFSKNKVNGGA